MKKLIMYGEEEIAFEAFLSYIRFFPGNILHAKNLTEEDYLECAKCNGLIVKNIMPSHAVALEAIKQNPMSIIYIANPTVEMQVIAASAKPVIIYNIKNILKKEPCVEAQLIAIKQSPHLFCEFNDVITFDKEVIKYMLENVDEIINEPLISHTLLLEDLYKHAKSYCDFNHYAVYLKLKYGNVLDVI